jgi:hypothetical protein
MLLARKAYEPTPIQPLLAAQQSGGPGGSILLREPTAAFESIGKLLRIRFSEQINLQELETIVASEAEERREQNNSYKKKKQSLKKRS